MWIFRGGGCGRSPRYNLISATGGNFFWGHTMLVYYIIIAWGIRTTRSSRRITRTGRRITTSGRRITRSARRMAGLFGAPLPNKPQSTTLGRLSPSITLMSSMGSVVQTNSK